MIRQKGLKLNVWMPILITLCLVLVLACTAEAAEYTRLGNLVSVADGQGQALNTIRVSVSAGELRAGDTVLLSLPKDFRFNGGDWSPGEDGADMYYGDYDNGCYIYIPWSKNNGLNLNVDELDDPMATDIFAVDQLRDNEIRIQVNSLPDYPSSVKDGFFLIYLKDVDIPNNFRGAIQLSFNAPPGSGFGNDELTGGRVGRLDPEPGKEDDGSKQGDDTDETEAPDGLEDKPTDEEEIRAVFTLGETAYTLNEIKGIMDVAPYAKDGRAYLPVRYIAQALGIKSNNVLWEKGTATFVSGDRRVAVTIGSRVMYIDGTAVAMDAAPEIANGRTMLPIRWIARAFGVETNWDAATEKVTVKK